MGRGKMKTVKFAALVLVSAVALSGCDNVRKSLTQTKAAPDEFSVYTRAPLTLPPDFGLRPPSEGAETREADNAQAQARRVLLSGREAQKDPIQADTPGASNWKRSGLSE